MVIIHERMRPDADCYARAMTPLAKVAGAGVVLVAACGPAHAPERAAIEGGSGAVRHCTEDLDGEACGDLSALLLPAALPPARGNAHAESFDAALLGFRVFFDARFSKNGDVRCESCHSVDSGFADREAVPVKGLGPGVRNAPTIFNAARHATTFWDGRVDSLWSQPLLALENPDEMGTTRLEIVHRLGTLYAREYEKAFGALHDFSDAGRFPPAGKPGDPAFDTMTSDDRLEVNRAVANLGKALEAYMRKIAAGPSAVDRFLAARLGVDIGYGPPNAYSAPVSVADGGDSVLTAAQRRGLATFVNTGCLNCHAGPTLSDDAFHVLGVPALPGKPADAGLSPESVEALGESPFNAAGPFFDGRGTLSLPSPEPGALRTPSLRNLTRTAPYGHDGVFTTLEDVVDFHLAGGGKDPSTFVGTVDPKVEPQTLSEEERADLLEFLKALDGDYPKLPWGQWPNGNG
jgi:cytochrome c peroxidase